MQQQEPGQRIFRPARWSRRAVLGAGLAVGGLGLSAGLAHARHHNDSRSRCALPGQADANPGPVHGVPFRFRYHDFTIRSLPDAIRPYHLGKAMPLTDPGAHDAEGVRMVSLGGRLYDHPVGQAQYGLNLLESHRITGNVEYLNRAKKQAQRLVDRQVTHRGAWFYPYAFRYRVHRREDLFDPPWYSMMAQGQTLSLFCRLHRLTGEPAWRAAAAATFASFLVTPVAGKPWGVYVVDGLLWLEEYPHPGKVKGDRTYNGHTFSAYGLWDYWMMAKDERAKVLLQGALTTTREVYGEVRNPGWRSKYCLNHANDAGDYHTTHMTQHIQCYSITGDETFAQTADAFYADFPPSGVTGTVLCQPGEHTGYRFDDTGRVLATKSMTPSRPIGASSAGRVKVKGHRGIWYQINGGELAGYCLPETPGHSYQTGACAALGYRRPRPALIAAAPVKAYTINANGAMASAPTTYRMDDPVALDERTVLNGVEHLRLANGEHAGQWVQCRAVNWRDRIAPAAWYGPGQAVA